MTESIAQAASWKWIIPLLGVPLIFHTGCVQNQEATLVKTPSGTGSIRATPALHPVAELVRAEITPDISTAPEYPKGELWDTYLGNGLPEIHSTMSLDECLQKAMEVNRKRPASQFALAVAEAQHQQAMASYWPQVDLQASSTLRSTDMNYIFPAQEFHLPETNIAVPASSLDLAPLVPFPIPIPAKNFAVPAQTFNLPAQDIKVMDRRMSAAKIDMKWLLWNNGWRKALTDQAAAGILSAEQDKRRSDLEIVYDVRKMYYSAVLANQLKGIGTNTLESMEALLELTEQLYQGGSMQVKKTDYLRNKVMVETLRGMVAQLCENQKLAESALVHAMGLSWRSSVQPELSSIPFHPLQQSLDDLVGESYSFSPDWNQLKAGLLAAEAKVREEKATYSPKIALIGNLHGAATPYHEGHSTEQNLNAWNVGVGMEMPLYRGGLTKAKVAEAEARLDKMKTQRFLLAEGLALQIKALLIQMEGMKKQEESNVSAKAAAVENRELSEKAYRNDLIEADKVFQSQLMEAFQKVRSVKLRYDHTVASAKLDYVVGSDLLEQLGLN